VTAGNKIVFGTGTELIIETSKLLEIYFLLFFQFIKFKLLVLNYLKCVFIYQFSKNTSHKMSTDYNLAFINADTEAVWTSLVNSLDLTC